MTRGITLCEERRRGQSGSMDGSTSGLNTLIDVRRAEGVFVIDNVGAQPADGSLSGAVLAFAHADGLSGDGQRAAAEHGTAPRDPRLDRCCASIALLSGPCCSGQYAVVRAGAAWSGCGELRHPLGDLTHRLNSESGRIAQPNGVLQDGVGRRQHPLVIAGEIEGMRPQVEHATLADRAAEPATRLADASPQGDNPSEPGPVHSQHRAEGMFRRPQGDCSCGMDTGGGIDIA